MQNTEHLDALMHAACVVREGVAGCHSDADILRARILLERDLIAANRPHPPGKAYCTLSIDERRERVAYWEAKLART